MLWRRPRHRHDHRASLSEDPGTSGTSTERADGTRPSASRTRWARAGGLAAACAIAWGGWQYFGTSEPAPSPAAPHNTTTASEAVAETASDSAAESESDALTPNAVVLAVIDGDTIEADVSGRRTSVRLIGIDTPEKTGGYLPAECGGDAATVRARELLPAGTPVLLQRDDELYDRYDRLLAYVYRASDGLFVNRYLVLDGYAGTMHFEPNTTHRDLLDAAQSDARVARRGIWADCGGPNQRMDG